jgi:hypothetical protein
MAAIERAASVPDYRRQLVMRASGWSADQLTLTDTNVHWPRWARRGASDCDPAGPYDPADPLCLDQGGH